MILTRKTPHLYEAFESSVALLGEGMKNAMIRKLKTRAGVNFDEPSLTMVQLYQGIAMLYGNFIAEMIMESVIIRLDEITGRGLNEPGL